MQACLSWLAPLALALACALSAVSAEQPVITVANASSVAKRSGRLFSAFNVVRFPNTACAGGSNQNGTCYTSEECLAKGGTSSGSCAAGYGVCCVFSLNCGGTSSQNCTYFTSTGSDIGDCSISICPCNGNICQLRLDFGTFSVSGPTTSTLSTNKIVNGEPVRTSTIGKAATLSGNCLTDSFSVTNPGGNAPPVICGLNTGQHMYVDASRECNDLAFQLGTAAGLGSSIGTRQWNIKVTQYACDYNNLAPQGCTQYFYGSTSQTVQTFNFDGGVHLANQNQEICVRRERGNCRICWSATADLDFDVSGPTMAAKNTDSVCCQFGKKGSTSATGYDCLIIPGALNTLAASKSMIKAGSRFCGRQKGLKATPTVLGTVCTNQVPFNVRFLSDMYEYSTIESMDTTKLNKGIRLGFIQKSSPCTTASPLATQPVLTPDGLTGNQGR